MNISNKSILFFFKPKNLLIFLILINLLYFFISLFIPPFLNPDSAVGFDVWDSMMNGSCLNCIQIINPSDISSNIYGFMKWWTPGQYLIPGFISLLFKISLGFSISVTILICNIFALTFLYYLYLSFGFSSRIALLSLLFISLKRDFSFPYNIYNGGEIVLFGGLPLIIFLFLRYKDLKFFSIIILIIICYIGFILKSSFLVSYLAVILSMFVIFLNDKKINSRNVINKKNLILVYSFKILFISFVFFLLIFYTFLRGDNPSKLSHFNFDLQDIFFTLAIPLSSIFSVDSILSWIFLNPYRKMPVQVNLNYIYLILSALSVIYLFFINKKLSLTTNYKIITFSFLTVFFVFFTFEYLFDAPISYEARHFRIIGLLLTPTIFKVLLDQNSKNKLKFTLLILIMISVTYGTIGFYKRTLFNYTKGTVGNRGITHHRIDNEALEYLNKFDQIGNNILFYIIAPEIGLEIENNRKIYSFSDEESIDTLSKNIYLGRESNIILLLKKKMNIDGRTKIIKNSFKNYDSNKWQKLETENFEFYFQGSDKKLSEYFN